MDGKSLNIAEEKLNKLKKILPEAFTEKKIDWEKLKAALGDDIEFKNERYVLNWAGKSDAFRVLQSPTTATLAPEKDESVNFDSTENIFIEGENLEVLKVLQKSYFGKIKMIYIDPPYNTGNDNFIYPDKFSETRDEYLGRIGDKDETGYLTREGLFRKNSKDSGHYHSNWLSMMYPRLFLARNLLRDDGVIFVSIDDNEVHNLRLLLNEVFGEENFVATIIWQKKYSPSNDAKWLSDNHDYILLYAKSKEIWRPQLLPRTEEANSRYINPDNDPRGDWKPSGLDVKTYSAKYDYEITVPSGRIVKPPKGACWRVSKERFQELVKDKRIWFGRDGNNVPAIKRFLSEVKQGITPLTIWLHEEVGHNQEATQELKGLGIVEFDSPKPVRLMKQIVEISSCDSNDIILDFFSGSGTTAQAVLALNKEDGNRKFILVQLPEQCDENSEAYKAGYKTIAEIGKERIRRVIKRIEDEQEGKLDFGDEKPDLGFKVFKLQESNFKIWRTKIESEEQLIKQLTLHTDPVDENAETENILYELLLK
ncbi:site-specific DNA-methyltransferase [Candidatus Oleimmundimicrobium sp.]|uniref:site-specific DNA-methyltransferase n=1 Tax=Candidatus Oleimmundimicrobium sp. TaxID=3060597 RepID=UPI002721AE95|nr:site-specific DNA-methyltransferase [Candidatus Oleimmundimicrobium sp.]MDO8886162.1 site-specific DNA-methyltransferase [Candidatus Oleimmundimicrobium sp.]